MGAFRLPSLRKQSLSRKLTLIVAIAVLAAVAAIAAATVWQEARRHTQAKLDYLRGAAAVFGSATANAIAHEDRRAALLAIRGIGRAPHLLYASVETLDGRVLAEIGTGISMNNDVRYGIGRQPSLLATMQSGTIQLTHPVINGGRTVGSITLVADNSDLAATLTETLLQTLIAALAALAIGVVVAARLQQWVVRPLLKLTGTVRAISSSLDYSTRVEITTDDEVGELCAGFNTMLGEIKDRERKIMDLATHDAETDLPNRVAFERDIGARLAKPRRAPLVVAAVSVDRFDYLRGTIGYHLASDLLSELGARAASATRGVAARISPDAIGLAFECADDDVARMFASRVLAELEAPLALGADSIDVNLTMGLAVYHRDADDAQALIECANIALDQARAARVKIGTFDKEAYAETARNLSLMTEMTRALESDAMAIALQPKYDIRSGRIGEAEVLVRWRHPVRGFVPPDLFITKAEETGAIGPLTEWVLAQAIACQTRLAADGHHIAISVNLSGRLLDDADFLSAALALIAGAAAPICLEITETATIGDQERALRHIDTLVAAGARISIDDYGAGLSSLAYLKRIPADELKIDKAFIQSLGEHKRDALLVKSTIDLAHSLGMKVTAEGVETETVLAALGAMGCDCAQGYLIAQPMAEADFVAFLAARRETRDAPLNFAKA